MPVMMADAATESKTGGIKKKTSGIAGKIKEAGEKMFATGKKTRGIGGKIAGTEDINLIRTLISNKPRLKFRGFLFYSNFFVIQEISFEENVQCSIFSKGVLRTKHNVQWKHPFSQRDAFGKGLGLQPQHPRKNQRRHNCRITFNYIFWGLNI